MKLDYGHVGFAANSDPDFILIYRQQSGEQLIGQRLYIPSEKERAEKTTGEPLSRYY